MTPQPAEEQAVSEIYELLRLAAGRRQPVAAIYAGLLRLLCPHVLGRKSGRLPHVLLSVWRKQSQRSGDGIGRNGLLALPRRGETHSGRVARGGMAHRATLSAANLHR